MTMKQSLLSRQAFTSGSARPARRQPRTLVCAAKEGQEQQTPKNLVMKAVGALTAAQLALLPLSGAAMARDVPARGETAVEGAVKAGKAAQEALPKGATEYKTREDRNNSRDEGLQNKLSLIKRRISPDNILNDPDIESGGRQNIFSRFVGAPLDAVNPATANPTKPVAFRGDASVAPSLQVNVDFERAVDKAQQAASKAASQVQGAPAGGGSAGTDSLGDNIKRAAITSQSPAGAIAKNLAGKKQGNVSFTPAANMVFQTAKLPEPKIGEPQPELKEDADMSNASFQGPESNEGGVTQPTTRPDQNLSGNPKRGGDLKDSGTEFAAQNKGEFDRGTPGQTGASARAGANTPKGMNELQNPKTPTLPNALGGKNFVRDDSETPEQTAAGNIAKAQQSSGNAFDSIKKGLGL
jgi:hypothetical protein